MDYEEKYKAALGWMQSLYGGLHGATKEEAEKYFPELKESEDDKIREKIMNLVKKSNEQGGYALQKWEADDMLAWLEKQGKQQGKSTLEAWKNMRLEVYQQASGNRHEPNYSDDTTKMFSLNDIDEIIEKMSEQSHNDMVEPKFKVGEWVVYDHRPYQVVELPKEGYINLGLRRNGKVEFAPSPYCRHWTIADAKAGDVLVASDGSIFLVAGVDDCACKYYVALTTDNYVKINKEAKGGYWETSRAVYPATKEQRDLLFQKMADAGYEFVNGHITRF